MKKLFITSGVLAVIAFLYSFFFVLGATPAPNATIVSSGKEIHVAGLDQVTTQTFFMISRVVSVRRGLPSDTSWTCCSREQLLGDLYADTIVYDVPIEFFAYEKHVGFDTATIEFRLAKKLP